MNRERQPGTAEKGNRKISKRSVLIFIAVLTAVALGMRLVTLSRRSLWLDEAVEAGFAALPLHDCWYADPNVPPLNRTLLHFWTGAFGGSEFSLRFPAAIFGTLCVPAIYLLGAQTFGRRVGLTAALLTAVGTPAIEFSQEARQYALLVLVTILATYFFIRAVDKPRRKTFALYGLCAAIGIYTFYLFALVILGHLIGYALSDGKSRRGIIYIALTCILIALAFLPWLPQFLDAVEQQDREWVFWMPFQVYHTFHHFGPGMAAYDVRWLGSGKTFAGEPRADLAILYSGEGPATAQSIGILGFYLIREVILIFGYVVPLMFGLFLAAGGGKRSAYFTIAFALPVILLAALFWWIPVLYPRYLKFLFPFFILLVSLFLCHTNRKTLRTVTITCLTALTLLSLGTYYFSATYGKEDYRSAAEYLNDHAKADDVIVCCPGYTDTAVRYYYRGAARLIRCESSEDAGVLARSLATQEATHDRSVWLIVRGNMDEREGRAYDAAFCNRFGNRSHRRFEQGWGIHLYSYKDPRQ